MSEPRNPNPGNPASEATTGIRPEARAAEEVGDLRARQESLGDLLKEVSQDLSTLIRQEVDLAKAEMRESATKAGKGAGMFTGAALSGSMVLLFLSLAAWTGISYLTGPVWSAIIVAVIWAIVAAILALTGKKELKTIEGAPRTAETVKDIPKAFE